MTGYKPYRVYQGAWIGLPTPPLPPAPPPPGAVKPDATNTGYGTATLQNYAGDFTNLKAGDKVTRLAISGGVKVTVPNASFDQCRFAPTYTITGTSNRGVIDCNAGAASGFKVSNSEILLPPQGISTGWTGILGHDYTATACNVHDVVDAFGVYNVANKSSPANVLIDRCFGHDLLYISPDANHSDNHTHNDGLQIQGNGTVTVTGSTLWSNTSPNSPTTSPYGKNTTGQALTITPNVSNVPNVTVDGCWLDYGSYTLHYINNTFVAGPNLILNNIKFGRNAHFGPIVIAPQITTFTATGLVYEDTGAAVTILRA